MRSFNRVALAPILLLLVSQFTFAQFQYPRSGGAVDDFARKLTPTTRQRLETGVTEFQRRSGIDLRVVTVSTSALRGRSIEEYSMGLARFWGVGRGSGSRGLLLVVAIGSPDKKGVYHGATRLEVSRNLERDIPNKLAGEVTSRMRESLMAGWFDEALTIGVDGVVSAIDQKQRDASQNAARGYPPPAPANTLPAGQSANSRSAPDMFGFVLLLLFLVVPAIIIAAIVRGIARSTGPGHPAGGRKWRSRRGGIGIGTGIALSGAEWITEDSSTSASIDASTADRSDSTSSSSSWADSSSSSLSDSSGSSFGDSSSSSFSDSNSSSSSGGDFGGGGSTDSW